MIHGLRTPNDGINQRNLKNWADVAGKIMLWPYLKIWDWDLIFGRAVKAISSLGVRSPCYDPYMKNLNRFALSKSHLHVHLQILILQAKFNIKSKLRNVIPQQHGETINSFVASQPTKFRGSPNIFLAKFCLLFSTPQKQF
jgi:hypothetical protein